MTQLNVSRGLLDGEVWVEAVFDALSPLELDEAVAAERLDVDDAHRIRLRKDVHVTQVPAK